MKRTDLHLTVPDPSGDRLVIDSEGNETYISVIDEEGISCVELDDNDLRTIRDHLTMILETRP